MGALQMDVFTDKSSNSDEDYCIVDEDEFVDVCDPIQESIASSVKLILHGLAEDPSRDGLLKTPSRVARAFLSATKGYKLSPSETLQSALFAEAGAGNGQGGGRGGMVIVRNMNLFSTCESCLLPFRVRCHIGYIPAGNRVVGLSKLPRVGEILASRLQNPSRLVDEIAEALSDGFKPLGVAVFAETWHINNGNWRRGAVYAKRGKFETSESWSEFLDMLHVAGIQVGKKQDPCPFLAIVDNSSLDANMVREVENILRSLGEDPTREELKHTPSRYVNWLLTSTQGSRIAKDINDLAMVNAELDSNTGMKTILDIPFCSQCEHHLLPFTGVVHIGYLRKYCQKVDEDALHKIVNTYSCRLQVQERLTRQIAENVMGFIKGAKGVMVVVEAEHVCMSARGVRQIGATTATLATLGEFVSDGGARGEFIQALKQKCLLT